MILSHNKALNQSLHLSHKAGQTWIETVTWFMLKGIQKQGGYRSFKPSLSVCILWSFYT